ncbi:MAG: hypothetical protein AAGI23_07690 [Bacteroidota bacterium]
MIYRLIYFCAFITLASTTMLAQSETDLRLGIGFSFLGSGDLYAVMLENELNHTLNDYFTLSGNIGYGRSNNGVFEAASFLQGNANIFFSPLKNIRRNDLRIGGGLSYCNISDAFQVSGLFRDGGQELAVYALDQRTALGFNIIIENTIDLSDRFLLGIKAFTQPYLNGDINSGILMKFGVKF